MKYRSAIMFIIWLAAGYLSSLISVYVFHLFFSSIASGAIRSINHLTASSIIRGATNIIVLRFTDFLFCFLVVAVLSFFTESTRLRLVVYIIGTVCINLYLQLEALVYYLNYYSELPGWVISYQLNGFISLLLLLPFVAFLGNKVGEFSRKKVATL